MYTYAFSSGMYAQWHGSANIGVPNTKKGCSRILIRGLSQARKNSKNGNVTNTELTVNGEIIELFSFDKDRVVLFEPLPKGSYYVRIKLTYDQLEAPVFRRYNE